MSMNKGLAAGLVMAGMMGESFVHRGPPPMEERGWRERVKGLTISSSAHTPKPEVMYAAMIADGSAVLIRRRNKSPLLKRVARKRS